MSTNEQNAKQLLAYLKNNGVHATIAGGFLRDGELGGTARDIDLYANQQNIEAAMGLLVSVTPSYERIKVFQKGDAAYDHQSIDWHIELEPSVQIKRMFPWIVDLNIDFVCINDNRGPWNAKELIERFNIGVNQIGMSNFDIPYEFKDRFENNEYRVWKSPTYMEDSKNGTATVLRMDWGFEHTGRNLDKLRAKYPGMQPLTKEGYMILDVEAFKRGTVVIDVSRTPIY